MAFCLKESVPSDPIITLLSVQGVDESSESFSEAYDLKAIEMGMNLPSFYFSIDHNYTSWIHNYKNERSTKQFVSNFALAKYKRTDIIDLVSLLSELEDNEKRLLLVYDNPDDILMQLSRPQLSTISPKVKSMIKNHLGLMEKRRLKWHYPVLSWHGLDNQYHIWFTRFISGDFGVSLVDAQPVFSKILNSIKWTLMLLITSLAISGLISFLIGIYNGINQGSRFDRISNGLLFLFYSIPKFWLATLMIIFFTSAEYGNWTNIFPSVGDWPRMTGFFEMIYLSANKLLLPVIVIVIPDVAYLSRLIRASIIDENNKEYIKTARSKGIPERKILLNHLVPNAMIPTITLFAGVLPGALGSSLIIEVIFNIPGVGRLMYESIKTADWAIVFPIIMIVSILTVVIFLLADLLIAWLNPKIKLG